MTNWTPKAAYYDFGRPFPSQDVSTLFKSANLLAAKDGTSATFCEFGAGTGRILLPIVSRYPRWQFQAIDKSRSMLDILDYRLICENLSNVELVEADSFGVEDSKGFDFVLFSSVLHAIRDWRYILNAAVSNLRPGGHILLLGEEADIHNEALARRPENLSAEEINPLLCSFWAEYRNIREKLILPPLEQSQIGARWDLRNIEATEYLAGTGWKLKEEREISWSHQFLLRHLLTIVEERCYSSMFTVKDDLYRKLIEMIKAKFEGKDLSLKTPSRHIACLRIFGVN